MRKLKEVETLAEKSKTTIFYKSINDMRNNFKPRITMCRHKNGNLIQEKGESLRRYVEHSDEVLNREEEEEENETTRDTRHGGRRL